MRKLAKIINNETKQVAIASGDNIEYYKSLGFSKLDVEQSWDDSWYLVGYVPEAPLPTPEEIQAEFTGKIQGRLDDFARTRGYGDILSACTYATSAIDKFRFEGQRCVDIRDQTWAKGYELVDEALSTVNIPTWEEIEAQLPELTWEV